MTASERTHADRLRALAAYLKLDLEQVRRMTATWEPSADVVTVEWEGLVRVPADLFHEVIGMGAEDEQ